MTANSVVGLGLSPAPQKFDEDTRDLALRVAAVADQVGFVHGLSAQDYALAFAAWMRRNPGLRVAMLPFGKFARKVASTLDSTLLPGFFDRNPQGEVRGYADLDPSRFDTVVISSPAFEHELLPDVVDRGFDRASIVTVSELFCALNHWLDEGQARLIAEYVRQSRAEGGSLAVYSIDEWGISVVRQMKAAGCSFDMVVDRCYRDRADALHQHPLAVSDGSRGTTDIIVASPPEQYRDAYSELVADCATDANVVFPFYPAMRRPALDFFSAAPVLAYYPPFAGAGRFGPTFFNLAVKLGRHPVNLHEVNYNHSLLKRYWRRQEDVPESYRSTSLQGLCLSLKNFEFSMAHHFYDLSALADFTWVKVLALMRDPRDMLNSHNFAVMRDYSPVEYERLGLEALDGRLYDSSPMRVFHWPPMRYILDSYLAVQEQEHMRAITFEGIHADPRAAYTEALEWLGWLPDPLDALSDKDFAWCIHLGSFEYQTRGKRKRGDESADRFSGGSCRKGITGDWKNHWSERLKDRFKEIAGDSLIRLGYERDNDW